MRRYETIAIIDPDIPEDDRTSLLTRIKEIIPQQDGVVLYEDLWGTRKLAYPVKKKPRGYYARYDYCGMGKAVEELERFFRIDDRVLKYLTVLLNPDADVEKIQAEIAEAQAASTSTGETPPAQSPAAESAVPTAAETTAVQASEPTAGPAAEADAPITANDEAIAQTATDQAPAENTEKE
jgi:small subunit ribosomal protein S6